MNILVWLRSNWLTAIVYALLVWGVASWIDIVLHNTSTYVYANWNMWVMIFKDCIKGV